jgi:hypothetical protein
MEESRTDILSVTTSDGLKVRPKITRNTQPDLFRPARFIYSWQKPPQHRGIPQDSPPDSIGSELAPSRMLGAAGALINRVSLVLPHCGHRATSSSRRINNSTV